MKGTTTPAKGRMARSSALGKAGRETGRGVQLQIQQLIEPWLSDANSSVSRDK